MNKHIEAEAKGLKEQNLLEIGDQYVFASWSHPSTDMMLIAIYRDYEGEGRWQLEQLRGPFSKFRDGVVLTEIGPESYASFKAASLASSDLFIRLNGDGIDKVKADWSGTLYDR